MSLLDELRSRFTKGDRSRGRGYFDVGFVTLFEQNSDSIAAEVYNGAGESYETRIELDDGIPTQISCDCMRFEDTGACKHVWATALQYAANFGRKHSTSSTTKKPVSRKKRETARSTAPKWLQSFKEVDRLSDSNNVAQMVRPGRVREQRIWYVITLNRAVTDNQLRIEFEQQVRRQNGEWGLIKPLVISDKHAVITDPAHREAIRNLNAWRDAMKGEQDWKYSYYRYQPAESQVTEWKVPAFAYNAVLPKLFETNAVRWRLDPSTLACDGFPTSWDERLWSLHIDVATDEAAQEWIFSGQLKSGRESVALNETVFVFPEGLVLFPNHMARFDSAGHERWLGVLLKNHVLRVPFRDRDRFVKEFGTSAMLFDLKLPEELLPPAVTIEPEARVRLKTVGKGRAQRVHGRIDFLYDDVVVRVNSSQNVVCSEESQIRYRRDINTETRWLSKLPPDLRPYDGRIWEERPDVDCLTGRMVSVVGDLLEAGWNVEVEEQKVRQGSIVKASVSSEIDWFDLDGEFEFDETTVQLPDILEAAKSGKKFVRLRDGSLGMLPQSWLDQNESLISLGEVADGKVRFRQSQAMLLDSLLAAQPNSQTDRQFQNFCRKLKSFDGIKPKSAPRSFKGKLREYQRDGLAWLHFLREFGLGGCLADDMGLGKTVQVLALLESRRTRKLKAEEQRLPSLVVVPKSLVFNWIEEAKRFTPKLRVGNYTGTGRKELLQSIDSLDVLITTYGSTRIDIVDLQEIAFDYVILDESQAIKNQDAQAAKAVRLLNSRHRLAMTGTPIENHLGELWSLFEFLNPGMLGRSTAFKKLAKKPRTISKAAALEDSKVLGIEADEVYEAADGLQMLAQAIRPYMLRRTKQEVLSELPDKTEQTLVCELSPKQRATYNKIRDYYRANLKKTVKKKGLKRAKIQVLEALLRLRQAACHPGIIDDSYARSPSAKLDMLDTQLEEISRDGRKVLVFSQFTSLLSLVRDRLDKQGTVYEYLDGKTRDRQTKVDRFQADPECCVFLISLKAGGSGLNLTAAEYVFILDPWWNPAVEAQAIDRAHRIGQQNQVFAYRIIAKDTVEERILQLQASKRNLADSIITADGSLISDLSSEDLQLLLS